MRVQGVQGRGYRGYNMALYATDGVSPDSVEGVRMNVACRKAAEAVIGLVEDTFVGEGLDPVKTWRHVVRLASEHLPPDPAPDPVFTPMTDGEAKAFEHTKLRFGAHEGKTVGEVPIDYLCWLDGHFAWAKALHRYCASRRVQRQQPDNDD